MSAINLLPCPFCNTHVEHSEVVFCMNPKCSLGDGHPQQRIAEWNPHIEKVKHLTIQQYIDKYRHKGPIMRRNHESI